MSKIKIYQTVCEMCSANCGLNIHIKDGEITKVEGRENHPFSEGYLCPKGKAIPELIKSSDRLSSPLKRTGYKQWKEISWKEAFSLIADRLEKFKCEYGAETVAVHVGQAGVGKQFPYYARRFCDLYGTPNYSNPGSHCHFSKVLASKLTYGGLPIPDYENSDCIVLWGYNPAQSNPISMRSINKACSSGAELIIIDPYETVLARKADIHLQLKPGTDGALALGMLNVIIKEKLYNKKFIEQWTIGFESLTRHIENYPPEKVEKITSVPAGKIKRAARIYAKAPAASTYPGIAIELQTNGFQTVRAISILQAITANLDIFGGGFLLRGPQLDSLKPEVEKVKDKEAIGKNKFPLFYKYSNWAQANIYDKAILDGIPYHLKAMIIDGSNPVLTWPNTNRVIKSLKALDFLVVIDHFMTKTAELADIVLPATTFLSRNEIWTSYKSGEVRIGLASKVIEEENCINDWKFWLELASEMGYGDYFPWKNDREALNCRLKPLNLTVEELEDMPNGFIYERSREKKYSENKFGTPTAKVEIYSQLLADYGYSPLPEYKHLEESLISTPDIACKYPLTLSSGARKICYFHSRYRNISSLSKICPEPLVKIHPDIAEELGIKEDEIVIIESLRGSIEVKIKLNKKMSTEVIYIPHGWDEANVNFLTDNVRLDPVTGYPADRCQLVRIIKKQ